MFSCEICEIFKETFFYRTPPMATFETKHTNASATDLLHIRTGSLNWREFGHCKKEARKIDSLCFREVDVILIALAMIPKREGSIWPCSLCG